MAYGMEAGYVPGGFEATVSAPGPAVQGNEDILDFLRQMQFRQQRSQRLSGRRPGLVSAPAAPRAVQAPAREGDSSAALEALQLRRARAQEQDENDVRNLRKTPVNMGIYGLAFDWDARQMNPLQQRAVSPQNASFEGAGAFNPTARPQGADADWDSFINDLALRRAIGSSGGF